jgi:hypothetical protein
MFLTITITAKNMSKITAADTFSSCFIESFTAAKTMVADAQDQDNTRVTTYRLGRDLPYFPVFDFTQCAESGRATLVNGYQFRVSASSVFRAVRAFSILCRSM